MGGAQMLRREAVVRGALRWGTLGLTALVFTGIAVENADARGRHHRHHASGHESYTPPISSIVVDANSGAVLQSTNPDAVRHPASLTKMMTLYLLFERLQSGKLLLSSELPVSAHAAAQAPSKLGLDSGDRISVEDAIKAVVTKSANDVAVVIGEALGGDEQSFARMMTVKAHALGMVNTTYRNASGLPNDEQVTTARDQSIIGRALRDRFPQYFHYFATRSFAYDGRVVRGHNHLLENLNGTDGIKTGYINESGFNIVTSVHRGAKYVVAVVFGGRSARARDARVASLVEETMSKASPKRTAALVVEGWQSVKPQVQPQQEAEPQRTDSIGRVVEEPRERYAITDMIGSTAPIKPIPVKTIAVHASSVQKAQLSPTAPSSNRLSAASSAPVRDVHVAKADMPPPAVEVQQLPPAPPPQKPVAQLAPQPAPLKAAQPAPQQVASAVPMPLSESNTESKPRSGWMIQVGAFDDEKEAKHRLSAAQEKAHELGSADPFTEKVSKGAKALYRTRFAGLAKDAAESACKHLKRSDIPCMMLRN
jgi:D-alanyl-D-alanine carboxypeptidase